MAKENEITILDVDVAQVKSRLKEVGAKHIATHNFKKVELLLKSNVKNKHSWIRVRTDGKHTTITLKELLHGTARLEPMNEYEINVDSFKGAVKILSKLIDSKIFVYYESKREEYLLAGALVTVDKWPEIPASVEIEAKSMKVVKETYKRLCISGKLVGNISIHRVYKMYDLDFERVVAKNESKLKALLEEK